ALATKMLVRALDAGAPAAWVTGDEVYGANPGLRAELEARGVGYVLAVAAITGWSPPATVTAPMPCSGVSRRGPGSGCPPARAPRATGCTTGRSFAWTTAVLHLTARSSAGCWCAATPGLASWPSITAGCHGRPPWPPWSGS